MNKVITIWRDQLGHYSLTNHLLFKVWREDLSPYKIRILV